MKRSIVSLVAACLMAAALPVSSAAAASNQKCAGQNEMVTPVTLHVEIKPFPKKTYKVGEVVKVKVEVSRPAEEDPVGLGIGFERPYSQPAEGVSVGVGVSVGRVFLPGYGLTDEEGKTTVMIKLENYTPAAMAHVRAFAYKEVVYTTCLIVEEQGFRDSPNAFKVIKPGGSAHHHPH
jgi:hypothetical protein